MENIWSSANSYSIKWNESIFMCTIHGQDCKKKKIWKQCKQQRNEKEWHNKTEMTIFCILFHHIIRIVSIRWIRERMHNIYHTKRTHAYTLINPNSWTSKSSEKIRKTADGMRFDSMKSSSTWLTDRKSVKYPWVTAFLRREKNSRIIVS